MLGSSVRKLYYLEFIYRIDHLIKNSENEYYKFSQPLNINHDGVPKTFGENFKYLWLFVFKLKT